MRGKPLCIVTAALFLTPEQQQELVRDGNHEKLEFYRVKKQASLRAMRTWVGDAGTEVYCSINGAADADIEELQRIGVHVDDRRRDLAGKPGLQRQAAFRFARQSFTPLGVECGARLFLWTEPDKYHLSPAVLQDIVRVAVCYDLTIVNRSAALLASYNGQQADLERGSNRVLSACLQTEAERVGCVMPTTALDHLHGPRVFRGAAVDLPSELALDGGDFLEMYGVINKPTWPALRNGLSIGAVEIDGRYPEDLRHLDDGIDPGYRQRQNRGIVSNVVDWLACRTTGKETTGAVTPR
jgi:hypothetical protein